MIITRDQTLIQVATPTVGSNDPLFQRPMPHVGPLMAPMEQDESMRNLMQSFLKAGDIDLGSHCTLCVVLPLARALTLFRCADAYALGFTNGPHEPEETAEDDKKKKKKKKRKNRKAKKSAPGSTPATSANNTEDEDEGEEDEEDDAMDGSPMTPTTPLTPFTVAPPSMLL